MKTLKKIKAHSLTGRITSDLMQKAWKAVKRNRGRAGLDKVSIQMFERNLENNLTALMKDLKHRTYEPIPLLRKWIPKGPERNAKLRPLGIPAVRCRIAQEVIRQLINPYFERIFHKHSYGFRPGKNCHQAVATVHKFLRNGCSYVVDADIKGFFDNIPHELIMKAVSSEIADGNILTLIEKFLRAGVMEDGEFHPTTKGTPQGGVISPLLANAVLNHLDQRMEENGYRFSRYADDFVVLTNTRAQAESALTFITHVIEKELGLELSKEKTHISSAGTGFEFLGFRITRRYHRMRQKSLERFKTKIRMATVRSQNLDRKQMERLDQVIRGTVNYFTTPYTCRGIWSQLDRWIRKRLRCMKKKRISRNDNLRITKRKLDRLGFIGCQKAFETAWKKACCSHPWVTA